MYVNALSAVCGKGIVLYVMIYIYTLYGGETVNAQ